MVKNIISLCLLLVSVFLSFRHGWASLNYSDHPEQAKMIDQLGIDKTFVPFLGIYTILVGLLILFPKTYFMGNLLHAISIVTIMALALKTGNIKMALLEIPFLTIPLAMIWLKYPFKN